MKICIVAGIFEPEIGGPAAYAARLAHELQQLGNTVTVVTFSSSADERDAMREYRVVRVSRGGKILNRFRFFFAALKLIQESECVYMLDWFAAGLPAAIAARMTGTPYIVRVGGDYLWEQRYLESGKTPIALGEFYYAGFYNHYPILYRVIRFVLHGAAHVVFNSDIQRQMYEAPYALRSSSTIFNPVPEVVHVGSRDSSKKEFVFWGRFIVMKNITSLVRAFAKANVPGYTLALIGNGPSKRSIEELIKELNISDRVSIEPGLPRGEAFDRVKDSRAYILPSWTDIAPNQVLEALALRLPALVTKENYLSIRDQMPETIDPGSIDDIAKKLEMLADDTKYKAFADAFLAIKYDWKWSDVVQAHVALFEKYKRV
jgi:glycosyltransferase involved in cell wall biosynthesis